MIPISCIPTVSPGRRWPACGWGWMFITMTGWIRNSAYEQRSRWLSGGAGLGAGGVLPSESRAPFRLTQCDWEIATDDDSSYRHEIDRGTRVRCIRSGATSRSDARPSVSVAASSSAPSMCSVRSHRSRWIANGDEASMPSAPSTASRPRARPSALPPLARPGEQSALLGRFRGYLGDVDGSLIVGKRAEDFMVGVTFSAILAEAEVHGELGRLRYPRSPARQHACGAATISPPKRFWAVHTLSTSATA